MNNELITKENEIEIKYCLLHLLSIVPMIKVYDQIC